MFYREVGFSSLSKLQEYAKFIGKECRGDNFNEAYESVFGVKVKDRIKERSRWLPQEIPNSNIRIFPFRLDVGSSTAWYKITTHDIEIPEITKDSKLYFSLTTFLDTTEYHDEIFSAVRNYKIGENQHNFPELKIEIITCRPADNHWGIFVHVDLIVFLVI